MWLFFCLHAAVAVTIHVAAPKLTLPSRSRARSAARTCGSAFGRSAGVSLKTFPRAPTRVITLNIASASPLEMSASYALTQIHSKPADRRTRVMVSAFSKLNGVVSTVIGKPAASTGRKSSSFSCIDRQQMKPILPLRFSILCMFVNACVGSAKNIVPNREKTPSTLWSGSARLAASSCNNVT